MSVPKTPPARGKEVWFDGDFVPWAEANVHVTTHALHYGSSVFEGIRCYAGPKGPAVFRLREHLDRLHFSAKVIRVDVGYSVDALERACLDLIRRNGFTSCYLRPLTFRGAGALGLYPDNNPIHTLIAAWEWGTYLGADALEQGIDVMISSWRKPPPGTMPPMAKIGGAYVLPTLAKMEAKRSGFAEAILLDVDGRVAEGSGENLFAVLGGDLITPPLSDSILGGVTRRSILRLAKEAGLRIHEQSMSRTALHLADELFFTGTAAEVTPITSVDRIPVGTGKPGPVTQKLQAAFFGIVNGTAPDPFGWMTPVNPA